MPLGIKIPKNVFSQGREKLTDFEEDVTLPPGNHICVLKDIRGVDTKKGPSVVFEFRIGAGCVEKTLEGCKVTIWFSLEPERVQWLLRAFGKFGIDPASIDEDNLDEAVKAVLALEPVCLIAAKYDGQYTNLRIQKYLDGLSASDYLDAKGTPAPAPDPIPAPKAEAGKEEEEEEEVEGEEEAPKADDKYTEMTRPELITACKLVQIKAFKSDSDDALRDKLRGKAPPF
jgi:hypothetical protein